MQLNPKSFPKWSTDQLKDAKTNVILGLIHIKEAMKYCKHKAGVTFMVCYNAGITGGAKYKHPELSPYVKAIKKEMREYANTN